MFCKSLLSLAGAVIILSGCATVHEQSGSADAQFSEATRWNAAMQIINPDPVYGPDDAQPGDNGAKAVGAFVRYRTDRVKEPSVQPTSAQAAGGGNAAGQGQGPQ